tara:strand:+ start:5396 stop:6181 length:786 start_codon:yes stop_codon:yes gene_type:complete
MKHIVSISGGTSSAVAANRVIEKYGKENVTLWFADTNWEDEDLYRFLIDLENKWDKKIERYKHGLNPLEIAEKYQMIPNSKMIRCSFELKIKPFTRMIKQMEKPLTVHIGLDWSEQHRMQSPKSNYESIKGVSVEFPLMWKPYETLKYAKVVESWGIKSPRLYSYGFPHNNCGGRCVRQGMAEWKRLKQSFPERFNEVKDWELEQQTKSKTREGKAILTKQKDGNKTPITLHQLEKEWDAVGQQDMFKEYQGDNTGCFCVY